MCWPCRNESCGDYEGYKIGHRTDKESELEEHYCLTCDTPLVRWVDGAWRRVGWVDVIHSEEYEELVVKTRVERVPTPCPDNLEWLKRTSIESHVFNLIKDW